MSRKQLQQIYLAVNKLILGLSEQWHPIMMVVTFFGGPVFIGLAVVLLLLAGSLGNNLILTKLAVLIIITHLLVTGLKFYFRKARPDTAYAQRLKYSKYSFPSGHSAVGMVTWYGLVLAASSLGAAGGWVIMLTLLSPLVVLLIGVSRVYLGAHYLIDVLAGWGLGLVVMLLFAVAGFNY